MCVNTHLLMRTGIYVRGLLTLNFLLNTNSKHQFSQNSAENGWSYPFPPDIDDAFTLWVMHEWPASSLFAQTGSATKPFHAVSTVQISTVWSRTLRVNCGQSNRDSKQDG